MQNAQELWIKLIQKWNEKINRLATEGITMIENFIDKEIPEMFSPERHTYPMRGQIFIRWAEEIKSDYQDSDATEEEVTEKIMRHFDALDYSIEIVLNVPPDDCCINVTFPT